MKSKQKAAPSGPVQGNKGKKTTSPTDGGSLKVKGGKKKK